MLTDPLKLFPLQEALPWATLLELMNNRRPEEFIVLVGESKHLVQDCQVAVNRGVGCPLYLYSLACVCEDGGV